LPPELLAAPRNRWDLAIEGGLAVLLAFGPLAFGAVEAWSELVVVALAAALSIAVMIRVVVDRTFHLPWTWAYVPLGMFLAAVAFQLIPLPRDWVAALSPTADATRAELLGEQSPSLSTSISTISMYPLATSHGLRLVMVGAAVFFVAAATIRTPRQVERVLSIILVIGCAEAGLALLQIFTCADRIYWAVDPGSSRLTSGSFINYSNFSQFMNLSLGAGLALLVVRLHEEGLGARRRGESREAFGGANLADYGGLLAGLILCALSVLASMSRNGAISMVAAAVVVGTALCVRGTLSRRGWVLAMLPLGALAVLLFVGFDAIYERLATLGEHEAFSDRWGLTLGALRAWRAFPVWGAGLGTHEYVFPMYDPSPSAQFAGHADNDYAQLLEETGVIGAVLVAAFLAVIATKLIRLCWRGASPTTGAAFGLAFGLIAVAIHSATDFGQHLPAVFCLSAVFCGMIVQLARIDRGHTQPSAGRTSVALRRGVAALATLALAGGWAWALRDAYTVHMGEQWSTAAYLLDEDIELAGDEARDEDYADLLAAAEQACAYQPADVLHAYTLNLYRWRAMSRDVDPETGNVRLTSQALPLVARIADDLAQARQLCPTYGPPYAFEGQLRLLVLGDEGGKQLIKQGVRLAPYDAATCMIAGHVAARDGAPEAAALIRSAVALDGNLFYEAIDAALVELKDPVLASELAGDDVRRLEQLAARADALGGHEEYAGKVREKAEAELRRRVASGDSTPADKVQLAVIDADRGEYDSAAKLYFDALRVEYGQIEWRLARTRVLVAAGRIDEALAEAKRCLTLRPEHREATQLVLELSPRVDAQ
jgi:O-antigen ligase